MLLTRAEFRQQVFARDGGRCVICGAPGQDAHHIIERRLFDDGGYYLNNGATLCAGCHVKAEMTVLTCEEIRTAAGITQVVLPPHLYPDQAYDKWGNPLLPNGQRLRGELFDDGSVQKILAAGGVLSQFTTRVRYPRTYHLPWSPGATDDDRMLPDVRAFEGQEVVVTAKMDGEQTTMYTDYLHARAPSIGAAIRRAVGWPTSMPRSAGGFRRVGASAARTSSPGIRSTTSTCRATSWSSRCGMNRTSAWRGRKLWNGQRCLT
jgi:hypothetical protein